MFIFYDLLIVIILLCYLPSFILRKKYHKGFSFRLGRIPEDIVNRLKDKDIIWIHAVSVGETKSAQPIIEGLREIFPKKMIVISTVTETGNQAAKSFIKEDELIIYLPLDLSFIVKKVINLIKPKIFIIVETEIWPNLILRLHEEKIPVVLINGRISPQSFRGYKLIKPLIKTTLNKIDLLCMQTEEDALRIKSLGAPADNIKITGNTKFDISVKGQNLQEEISNFKNLLKLKENDKIFVAGSTHHPEEKIIFSCYKRLLKDYPDLKLIIAPRHTNRTDKVEKEAKRLGFKPVRYSQLIKGKIAPTNEEKIKSVILDVMGKLKVAYAMATFVFVGGSLAKRGGHNMIEPASFAKPILFGPYVYNFKSLADSLLRENAAYKVNNEKELTEYCLRLLSYPKIRQELGNNAKMILEHSKGAAKKDLNLIKSIILREPH